MSRDDYDRVFEGVTSELATSRYGREPGAIPLQFYGHFGLSEQVPVRSPVRDAIQTVCSASERVQADEGADGISLYVDFNHQPTVRIEAQQPFDVVPVSGINADRLDSDELHIVHSALEKIAREVYGRVPARRMPVERIVWNQATYLD